MEMRFWKYPRVCVYVYLCVCVYVYLCALSRVGPLEIPWAVAWKYFHTIPNKDSDLK